MDENIISSLTEKPGEFKPHKTIEEQLDYLYKVKRVRYNTMNREDAADVLRKYGYINVVTPYKHLFARKERGVTIRDENNQHIYDRDVEFSEYYDAFIAERKSYPVIYRNIMIFEETFNAILSYELIEYYDLSNYKCFRHFINDLLNNLDVHEIKNKYTRQSIQNMRKGLYSFELSLRKYNSIYIFFDRLNLSDEITLFRCCPEKMQVKIFKYLLDKNKTFGYLKLTSFDNDFLTRIPKIRNTICHFNSLEVLINYFKVETKSLRKDSDKTKYLTVISKLSVQ